MQSHPVLLALAVISIVTVVVISAWKTSGNGTAAVWVKIPQIAGNARQEIKMYWGKADATAVEHVGVLRIDVRKMLDH